MFETNAPNWEGAACSEEWYNGVPADPNIFYDVHYKSVYLAKKVCEGCPLVTKCLEFALFNNEEWGVWGGYSAEERKALRTNHQITKKENH